MITSSEVSIDNIDKKIISLLQKDPGITHTEIAKEVNRSQPTIGLRIKKLEKAGIMNFQAGLNLKVADVLIARVDVQTNNPEKMLNEIKDCPYIINGFQLSGTYNLSLLIANSTLKHLDIIINEHFRNDPDVQKIHMEIVTNIINDFVLPMNMNTKKCKCDEKFESH
jgi:DNA-binding Lrp family transcriptional regulator